MTKETTPSLRQRCMLKYEELMPCNISRGTSRADFFINIMRRFYEHPLSDQDWDARVKFYDNSENDPSFSFLDMIIAEKKAVEFLQSVEWWKREIDTLFCRVCILEDKLKRIGDISG